MQPEMTEIPLAPRPATRRAMSYALAILASSLIAGPLCTYLVQVVSILTDGAYTTGERTVGLSAGSWMAQIAVMGVVSAILLLPWLALGSEVTEPRARRLLPGLQALVAVNLMMFLLVIGFIIETYLVGKPQAVPDALVMAPNPVFGGMLHGVAEFLAVMLRVAAFGIGAYVAACIARRPIVPPVHKALTRYP